MRTTLPVALELMFGHEGGYSNNHADPGGPTKYGVTLKTLRAHRGHSVTAADVKALSIAEAAEIYRKSYWTQSGGDLLPVGLDYATFDFGVNSGPATAVKKLQAVVGVAQDGIVGAQTVAAVNAYGVEKAIRDLCDSRMRYLRSLRTWRKFGRGWTIRVTGKDPRGRYKDEPGVLGNALRLAGGAPTTQPKPVVVAKANPSDRSIVDIVKDQPSLLVSLLTGLGALAAGTGPVQWALAACLVLAVGYGIYRLVKRDRATA